VARLSDARASGARSVREAAGPPAVVLAASGSEVSRALVAAELLAARGVEAEVVSVLDRDRFLGAAGRGIGVELTDGSTLDADLVVVAVGASPAANWLADSGLPQGNGVECDTHCQVSPGVYAAGDIASWHSNHFDKHRMNATEQAMAVAADLLGADRPFAPVPYFWIDQYDTRIQAYGIFPADADVTVLHGQPTSRKFVAGYGNQGKMVGLLGWNSPRELCKLRQLVVDRTPLPLQASLSATAVTG
jgi:NADPH-dependent 2,4-dienoyl-CoA reductase/sulfur reductase-like enzyme